MTTQEKLALIDTYEGSIDPLIDFVKGLPAVAIDYRPTDRADAWTIREHAVHMMDAESFGYGRVRLCVAEPGSRVFAWEEEIWHRRAHYETADALLCLEATRSLRRTAAAMLRAIAGEDWSPYYIEHPARGRLDLAQTVTIYVDHARFHLDYFRMNFRK